jgi:hypothetical protein
VIQLVVLVSLVCGVAAAAGWFQGYRSPLPYASFWLLSTFTVLSALFMERIAFLTGSLVDRIVRIATVAFSLIVLCGMLLGGLGWLGLPSYLAFFSLCFVATMWLAYRAGGDGAWPGFKTPDARWVFAVLIPLLVLIVAVGIDQWPSRYDSLNYHLYFPARWLHAGRLSIVPTPFGDEAPAYAPSNGELFFLWLMLPFHGDLLARIGQLPFYCLIAVTVYALARRAGAPPDRAVYPAAFAMVARPIVEEAVGADVDLVFTAMLLCAVHLGTIAIESNRRNDWLIAGAALGLCCGTKFLALVYLPVFLFLSYLRRPRTGVLWALPGILLFGLPWYIRNWIVAGSPIYPASLTFARIPVASGAFTHAAMLHSLFHIADFRLFIVVLARASGTPVFLVCAPFVVVGLVRMLVRPANRIARCLAIFPLAMVPLEWFGVPDNTDWRFIFPVVMLALVALSFAFTKKTGVNRALCGLYIVGLLWSIVGVDRQLHFRLSTLPFFMSDWLSLRGVVAGRFLPLFAILALVTFIAWPWFRRGSWLRLATMMAVGCAAVATSSRLSCPPESCGFLDLTSSNIRETMVEGWHWVRRHAHGETIAYAGNNIPYPLFGDRLANRVAYINIDRHLDWGLHNYDRARRRRPANHPVGDDDVLATPSGVLQPPVIGPDGSVDAVRPRFERMRGYRGAWISNLKTQGVTLLFVSSLSIYEVDYLWHDGGGFPIEDAWARADPASFVPVFANPQVRIYAVRLK